MAVTSTLDAIVSECVVSAKLAEAGIDPLFVQQISTNSGIKTFKLSDKDELAEETNSGNDFMMKLLVPMCFGLLIYMSLLLYGQMIGRSVVVEKSSKIVDVLISSVKPSQLLFGKITQYGQPAGGAAGQNAASMKMMMYGMPIFFFFLFYNAPSGLLIYWITSNVFQMIQQFIINAMMKSKKAEMENKVPAKKTGKSTKK